MKISAVVFDFGGVMTTTTMPQRVVELAKEKGIDWNVFADGFNAHRLEYDAGRITLEELYARIWSDVGLSVSAETTAAFMEADDVSPSLAQARELRSLSKSGGLNDDKVMEILLKEELTPINVRLKSKVLKRFFPQNYTSSQIEEVIIELLTGWAESRQAAG
mgnify:CR=1 FL=1